MKISKCSVRAAASLAGLLIAAVVAMPASAAILMQAEGIKGGVTDEYPAHKDWIELSTASWGVSQAGSAHTGGGGGATRASFRDFSWTQDLDRSTPTLFAHAADGEFIEKVTIDWLRDGFGPRQDTKPYFQIILTDVVVSSLEMFSSAVGDDVNTVVGSMNYAEIEMSYWTQGKDGVLSDKAVTAKYDLVKGEGSLASLASVYAVGSSGAALTAVPVPAAGWLLGSAVLGLIGFSRRRQFRD